MKLTLIMQSGAKHEVDSSSEEAVHAINEVTGQASALDTFLTFGCKTTINTRLVESIVLPEEYVWKKERVIATAMTAEERMAQAEVKSSMDQAIGKCNDLTEAGGLNPVEALKIADVFKVEYNDLARIVGLDIQEDGSKIEDPLAALGGQPIEEPKAEEEPIEKPSTIVETKEETEAA